VIPLLPICHQIIRDEAKLILDKRINAEKQKLVNKKISQEDSDSMEQPIKFPAIGNDKKGYIIKLTLFPK
jgi:hypothetical protein